jgi:hypothetical protein
VTANIASKPLTKVAWSLLLSNQSGDILEFEHRGQYPEVYHLNLELSRAFHRLSEQRQRRPIADHRWSSWQGGITLRMTHLDLPPFQNSSNIPQTAILSSQEHLLSESRLLHNCSISCEQTVWHTGTGRGDRESAGNILWHERLIPRLWIPSSRESRLNIICRPVSKLQQKAGQVYRQILPSLLAHHCFRHPRLMYSLAGCQDPSPKHPEVTSREVLQT